MPFMYDPSKEQPMPRLNEPLIPQATPERRDQGQVPPMRNPGPINVRPFDRRFNDPKPRELEHAAREIAQSEGPASEAWLTITRIDKYRRMGRVIRITLLYKVHGEPFHRIKWEEEESEVAKTHGYIDHTRNEKQPGRMNSTVIFIVSAFFIAGFYFGAAYNAFLR